jgi:hypothetical protein
MEDLTMHFKSIMSVSRRDPTPWNNIWVIGDEDLATDPVQEVKEER